MDVEWFKARKREVGFTDTDLADALGVERSVANKVANGHVSIRPQRLEAVAALLKVSRDELMFRAGMASQPTQVADQPVARTADLGVTDTVIRLDLSLPMGQGALVDDYVEEEPVLFDLGYLRSFTKTPPSRLRLAKGVGDSMRPTLEPSDVVWIDTTQNDLRHSDRIYACAINGGAAIKRLRPIEKGRRVLVISDNRSVLEPYEVDAEDVVIWGRVIRFARDL